MKIKIFFILISLLALKSNSYSQVLKTIKPDAGKISQICFFDNSNDFAFGTMDAFIIFTDCESAEIKKKVESSHTDVVKITISKDAKYLASSHLRRSSLINIGIFGQSLLGNSGSEKDRTISIWDLNTYKESSPINVFENVYGLDFLNDDRLIFSTIRYVKSYSKRSYRWQFSSKLYIYNSKNELKEINVENEEVTGNTDYDLNKKDEDYYVYHNVTKIDGDKILMVGVNSNYIIYDNNLGKVVTKLESKNYSSLNDLSISNNKSKMADCYYGDDKNWIYIWDLKTGKSIKTLKGHEKDVYTVAFSPDDKFLASGGKDETIKLWDVNSGKLIKTLKNHSDNVNCVRFSSDGKYLVSGGDDQTIIIWDAIALLPDLKIFATEYELKFGILKKLEDELKEQTNLLESNFTPKGEFETTEAFELRLKEKNDKIDGVNKFYQAKFEELKEKKKQELDVLKDRKQSENEMAIQNSRRDTTVKISNVGTYNADKQTYAITIKGMTKNVYIPIDKAPKFKENWKKAKVKCKKQLFDDLKNYKYFDFVIIDPVTSEEIIFEDVNEKK